MATDALAGVISLVILNVKSLKKVTRKNIKYERL